MIASGGNTLTISYLSVTIFTPSITGIACFIATFGYCITNFSICVILVIKSTVGSSTNGAVRLNLTGSSSATMVGLIELSSTSAGVEVLCSVTFPFVVCINVITICRNRLTICNLGFTILTPSIAGIACCVATLGYSITYFGIFMFTSSTLDGDFACNTFKIKIIKIEIINVAIVVSNPNIIISCSSRRIDSKYQSS